MRSLAVALLVGLALGIAAGLFIGYALWHESGAVASHETVQPGYVQADGSHVLPRVPVPAGNMPAAPHQIPKGAKEERRISVVIRPHPAASSKDSSLPVCSCDPVHLDLSLVKDKNGRRIVASSPDGTILDGIDTPLFETPEIPKNSVHAYGQPRGSRYAIDYTRTITAFGPPVDIGFMRVHDHDGNANLLGVGFKF